MAENSMPFNWPHDAEGVPKALITSTVRELIPTAKYANVEISNTVTKFVKDDTELSTYIEAAYDDVDSALQTKRDEILKELEEGNS